MMSTKTLKNRSNPFHRCVAAMLLLLFVIALAMPGVAGAQASPDTALNQSAASSTTAQQLSAQQAPQISLPSGVTMEKNTDISASMIYQLIGSSWTTITGNSGVTGQPTGMFGSLFVSILGAMNLAAMFFVGVAISYMWGMFAVTTAHEGQKLGGSLYNSLWVPVRHVFSFSLTIPMLNGLSLLQIALLAMVSLGINMANRVYDTAGAYVVKNMNLNLAQSANPMLLTEAYHMLPMMFDMTVGQEALRATGNGALPNWAPLTTGTKGNTDTEIVGLGKASGFSDAMSGQYYVAVFDSDKKTVTIYPRPVERSSIDQYPGIIIAYDPSGGTDSKSQLLQAAANARVKAVIALYQAARTQADNYLCTSTYGSNSSVPLAQGNNICNSSPQDMDQAVQTYVANVSNAINTLVTSYTKDPTVQNQISASVDSDGTKSTNGWVSAGMYSFALSMTQYNLDANVLHAVAFQIPASDESAQKNPTQTTQLAIASEFPSDMTITTKNAFAALPDNFIPALRNAGDYFSTFVMKNSSYASYDYANNGASGDGLDKYVGMLAKFMIGGSEASANTGVGVLSTVLDMLKAYDPIVVLAQMGGRLIAFGKYALIGSFIVSAIGMGTIGAALALSCLLAGIFLAFVVPILPVIFWMRAVFSWLFLVVESLVAAPFWACTHSLPEGVGFAGNHARQGYLLAVDIVVRPVILTAGALAALTVARLAGFAFIALFNLWFTKMGSSGSIKIDIVADISYAIIVLGVIYYLYYLIFTQAVLHMPEHISRWLGSGVPSLGGEHEGTQQAHALIGSVANQSGASGALQGAVAGAGALGRPARGKAAQKISEMMPSMKERKDEQKASAQKTSQAQDAAIETAAGIKQLLAQTNPNAPGGGTPPPDGQQPGGAQPSPNQNTDGKPSKTNPEEAPANPGGGQPENPGGQTPTQIDQKA